MKQFLFLAFLSILVLDEFYIKGAMGDNYDIMIEKFIKKIQAAENKERNILRPYFKRNKVNWLDELLTLFTFCAEDRSSQATKNMDWFLQTNKNMCLGEFLKNNDYYGVLSNQLKMDTLCDDIKTELSHASSLSFFLPDIRTIYENWKDKNITSQHVIIVAQSLNPLKGIHSSIFTTFEHHILISLNEKMETYKQYSKQILGQRRMDLLDQFATMQVDILEHLEKGKANLDDYYKQRAQWAQFIMGVSALSLVDRQVPNSTVKRKVSNSTVKQKVPNSTVKRQIGSTSLVDPNQTTEPITYQYLIEKLHEKATKVFFEYALTPLFTLCEDDVVSYITTSLDSFIEFFSSISLDAELLKNKNVAQINEKWAEMVARCNDIKLYLTTYATISAHVPHEIQSIYDTWQSSSISSSQEEDIETNLSGIKEVHGIYHESFIGLIHELIGKFQNFGEASNDIYNELLTSDLNRLKKKLLIYNRSQDEITYKLENALKILQNYCNRRINWAKSIMGIPITL